MKQIFYTILSIALISSVSYSQSEPYATFDATDSSYVDYGFADSLANWDTLSQNDLLTVTLWVRWGDKSGADVGNWANMFTMTGNAGSGDDGVFWFQHNSGNSRFEFAVQTDGGRSYVQGTTNPNEGQWYHLAGVYDGSNIRIYVDGVLEGTTSRSGDLADFESDIMLNMGRWPNSGNNERRFDGDIDEVSVWNKALNQTEVQDLMGTPEDVTGTSYDAAGLLGYWDFEDGLPTDKTPNGNNGVLGEGVEITGSPLPIELASFDLEADETGTRLYWLTASELNNDYFTLERSTDGQNFEPVATIAGAGNSIRPLHYEYTDTYAYSGTVYYRLKQTDYDGQHSYSPIISKSYKLSSRDLNLYPNPLSGHSTLYLELPAMDERRSIQLLSATGQVVHSGQTSGQGTVALNLDRQLQPGIYFLRVGNGTQVVSKQLVAY